MQTKKVTVNFSKFSPKELQLSSDINLSQYLNANIPQDWLPVEGTEWKHFISAGDYGVNGSWGDINITPEHILSFYQNWKDKVIGRDICFNYNHESGKNAAALWVRDLRIVKDKENNPFALEYLPLYTPSGLRNIIGQEWRYLS